VLEGWEGVEGALAERGFAAVLAGGGVVMVDDVALHRALLATARRWLG